MRSHKHNVCIGYMRRQDLQPLDHGLHDAFGRVTCRFVLLLTRAPHKHVHATRRQVHGVRQIAQLLPRKVPRRRLDIRVAIFAGKQQNLTGQVDADGAARFHVDVGGTALQQRTHQPRFA